MSYRLEPFHSSDSAILDPVCNELNFNKSLFKYKHKLADEERWAAVIRSNPKRVVSAIGLYTSPDATNQWGDTIADVHPLIQAAEYAAKKGGKPWANLVKAGFIDAVCKAVLEINTQAYEDEYPAMDPVIRKQVLEAHSPSYYLALWILFQAGKHLKRQPAIESSRVFALTVKKNWSKFMQRLWSDPDTKYPHNLYGTNFSNRIGLAGLFHSLLETDPVFINTIIDDSDVTLSLFTRYWTQAIKSGYLLTYIDAISEILCSVSTTILAPTPPLIHRIVNGADGSATTILSRVSEYIRLVRFPDALPILLFIASLYKQACRECDAPDSTSRTAGRDFVGEVASFQPLWTTMLDLLGRASLPENDKTGILVLEQGSGEIQQSVPVENSMLLDRFLDILWEVLYRTYAHEPPKDILAFVQVLVRADIFGVLDRCLSRWASETSFPFSAEKLARIFSIMSNITRKCSAEDLTPIMSTQFPRSRSLRSLLTCAFKPNGEARLPDAPSLDSLFKDDPHKLNWSPIEAFNRRLRPRKYDGITSQGYYVQNVWNAWLRLHEHYQDKNQCVWRDCTEFGASRCRSCQKARYCGAECQKRDWKEHRLVCGFQVLEHPPRGKTVQKVVMPIKASK